MNTHSFLLPFFESENETFKKLGRWEQNFLKYMEKIKSGGDKVQKFYFILISTLVPIMVSDNAFRKYISEKKAFLKKKMRSLVLMSIDHLTHIS